MLALVSVLMALPSLLMPVQDVGPTVTSRLDCPANVFVVIVDNPGDMTFEVEVHAHSGGTTTVVATATVGPASVVDIPVELDGLPLPVDVSVTGDNGFPATPIGPPIFGCPSQFDLTVTTPESTPVVVSLPGPCDPTTDPSHGTIETTNLLGEFLYTPDPGFVGEDTFDYECVVSASAFGTVSVIVTAAPSPSPAEVEPTFTG
jgi:Bacterial Ig domain